MANQHRARRPFLRSLTRAIFLTRFPRRRTPRVGAPEKGKTDPSLDSISFRKEAPVNWRCAIRDFLIAMSESWPFAAAPDDPGPRRPSWVGANCGVGTAISCAISSRPMARRRGAKKGGNKVALSRPNRPNSGPRQVARGCPRSPSGTGGIMTSRRRARKPSPSAIIAEMRALLMAPLMWRYLLLKRGLREIALYRQGRIYTRWRTHPRWA